MRRSQSIWPVATHPAGRANSNWTGRTPRTLEEAFGPYTSELLYEAKRLEKPWWAKVGEFLLCALAAVAIVALGFFGATS